MLFILTNDVLNFPLVPSGNIKEYLKMFYNKPIPNNSHITTHTVFPSLKTIKIFINVLKVGLTETCQNLINIYKFNLNFYFFFSP